MSEKETSDLIGQRKQRIAKIEALRNLGINPFPSKANRTHKTVDVTNDFETLENKTVTVSGRLLSWREHGHIIFAELQDELGQIQLYIRDDELVDTSSEKQTLGFAHLLEHIDIGDIVEATGYVTKTKKGEISVTPREFRILTKAIRPLPNKHTGLKDKELIFRKRYLDTTLNPEKRDYFKKYAQTLFAIRQFLNERGFLEIQTPILQPIYGGGLAKPFTTHVNALDVYFYMAISHELYLKRLITAGFENVYNIVGYFRNEGIDRTHNPQFNMLETMSAYQNYEYNMDLMEEMFKFLGKNVFGRDVFKIGGHDVDISKSWERIQMIDAVKKFAGYDFNTVTDLAGAHKILDEIKFNGEKARTIGEAMVQVFEEKVEEQLIEPTIIYGHPVEISPLAKTMADDPRFVERFEMFVGGIETGDNWSELNDPIELYERFKDQTDRGRGGQDEFQPMDVDFIEAMEQGMPPTTGVGPGIERLVMTFTETEYIDDVLFFPMMKPAPITETQKQIYGEEYLIGPADIEAGSATEQDFENRLIIVVNKEIEPWKVTNTIAHISGYVGAQVGKKKFFTREQFEANDGKLNANSQYPIITMAAKSSQQLYNLLLKVEDLGLIHLAYTNEMTETSDDNELQKMYGEKKREELTYLGIGFFGSNEVLRKLTNKFSLWK